MPKCAIGNAAAFVAIRVIRTAATAATTTASPNFTICIDDADIHIGQRQRVSAGSPCTSYRPMRVDAVSSAAASPLNTSTID